MNEEKENKKSFIQKPWVQSVISIIIIFLALGGFLFWQLTKNTVSIENSLLDAPIENISPTSAGMLNAIYVKDGDQVSANTELALVGSEVIYSKDDGIVSGAPLVTGSYYAPGQTVVSIIVNSKMRVVGTIEETKGLDLITPGQRATFTVDAFSGKIYDGIVDEISPTSNEEGVTFSISDKRPVQKFDIYVRFDTSKYPELKNGMSAKIKIYTKA